MKSITIAFPIRRLLLCLVLAAISVVGTSALAQELAPRAYWPAPKGTNVLVLGYQYSSGDILTDPSLPIIGVESNTSFAQISYQRTFSLFSRTANVQLNVPYTRGSSHGFAYDEPRSRHVSTMGDARVRLSVNLHGAPSMDAAGFQALRANPQTIVGASILIQAPTGGYEPDKLINAGTNRWAVKPAIGVIWPVRPTLLLEFELGAWFFGDNDDFLSTQRRQDPIYSSEFHLVKRIRSGFWASLDLNYYAGGSSSAGQGLRTDRQGNSRIGGTVVFPFKGRNAIRLSYSTAIATSSGGDFDSFSLNYLYAW